ncbi:hypothetical protein JHK86_009632 [Glycine max]|nr:hypothetical protein JHK86_009632 [Glycine max]
MRELEYLKKELFNLKFLVASFMDHKSSVEKEIEASNSKMLSCLTTEQDLRREIEEPNEEQVRVGATIRVDFVIVQWKLWEGVGTLARARSRPRQSTAAETAVASHPAATAAFSPRLAPGDTSTVRVFAAGDSNITTLKSGELVLETTTGIDGSFVAGPLYDDIGYNVEASKSGYHLKQVAPHSFTCQKLSQISVHIHHKDDSKEPIPSVLLSLSGDNGYRNNSVSGAGRTFLFDNLFPGMFYLRPVLKVTTSVLVRNDVESAGYYIGASVGTDPKYMSNLMEKRMSNKHVEPDPDKENMSSLIPECKKTSPRELKNHKKMVMRGNMDGSYQRHQKNTIHVKLKEIV